MMKMGVTAVTMEVSKIFNDDFSNHFSTQLEIEPGEVNKYFKDALAEFAGKNAGICYMSDSYESEAVSGKENASKRFVNTIRSTHHSIADHCKVTVLFENVPKIFAMIMNSFQDYATSEKSARYTIMGNLSDRENELYTKWIVKLKDILMTKYNVNENDANKLAMENARYFISIFSPATTFSYTTSIRQWNYINIWFKEIVDLYQKNTYSELSADFLSKLVPWLVDFTTSFEQTLIYNELITEPKSRRVDFIPQLYPDTPEPIYGKHFVFSDVYKTFYFVSFSCLAQLQRHRSIKYVINNLFDYGSLSWVEPWLIKDYPSSDCPCFIPDFLNNDDCELLEDPVVVEWITDMLGIRDLYPQGMKVMVVEMGTIDKFLLKCDERLCGRAQYETMKNCIMTLRRFHHYTTFDMTCNPFIDVLSPYFRRKLSSWFDCGNGVVGIKSKCQMRKGGCADKGGCLHGPCNATNRKF